MRWRSELPCRSWDRIYTLNHSVQEQNQKLPTGQYSGGQIILYGVPAGGKILIFSCYKCVISPYCEQTI